MYEWPRNLINPRTRVPYEKEPNVYLEKTDTAGEVIASGTFLTQSEVDEAWATGYHTPGKPETRDVGPDGCPEHEPEPTEPEEEPEVAIYACPDCEFSTQYESSLKRHITAKHED